MQKTKTITRGIERESNIELLRILAMFMVLVVHADFFAIGTPTTNDVLSNPLNAFTRILIEGWAIGCVNIFILISGWFGIQPKLKSFCSFIFQCIFFITGIYLLFSVFSLTNFDIQGIKNCLLLTKWYWFIKAYICLYILSPMLNAFIEHSTKKKYSILLVAFYIFQSVFGCFFNSVEWFTGGYSTISFIGLYLLAAYVRKYKPRFATWNKKVDCTIIVGMVALFTFFSYGSLHWEHPIVNIMLMYTNPIVVIMALYYLLLFSKMHFKNKIINWIAASSFAVFLFHLNHSITDSYFIPLIRHVYTTTSGLLCIVSICAVLIAIFVIAILIDQIRIFLWNLIRHLCPNYL